MHIKEYYKYSFDKDKEGKAFFHAVSTAGYAASPGLRR